MPEIIREAKHGSPFEKKKIPVIICDLDGVLNTGTKNPDLVVMDKYEQKLGKKLPPVLQKLKSEIGKKKYQLTPSDMTRFYDGTFKHFDGRVLNETIDELSKDIRLANGAKDFIDGAKAVILERMREQNIVGVLPEEHIFVISAGPLRVAQEAAKRLGLKEENIFASKLVLNEEKNILELDGKILSGKEKKEALTLKILPKIRKHGLDRENVIFIGDDVKHDLNILGEVADHGGLSIPINYHQSLVDRLTGKPVLPVGSSATKDRKVRNLKSMVDVVEWFSSGGKRKVKYLVEGEGGEYSEQPLP